MKELLEESASYFYTDLIMFLCSLFASVLGFVHRKKHEGLRYMFLYPFASVLQMLSVYFSFYILNMKSSLVTYISISLFLLIEMICFYFYFSVLIKNNLLLKGIRIVPVIYLSVLVFKWREYGFEYILHNPLYFTQSLMILALAALYLFFLFNTKPKPNLLNEPSFWITIGALLYFLCTVPIYISNKYIFNEEGLIVDTGLFSINYVCYSLLFLLLTRAYLCKVTAKP